MNTYEKLLDEVNDEIQIEEDYKFKSKNIKGLYCDNVIALSKDIRTTTEKTCVLAEEIGHHFTTAGDIIDQADAQNRKQELRARMWAYDKQIGLSGIIDAFENKCETIHDTAEYLGVTEEFLIETLEAYASKYGLCKKFGKYTIYFEPLQVFK